jgi:CHC2-type zinc finger protein
VTNETARKAKAPAKTGAPIFMFKQSGTHYGLANQPASKICVRQVAAVNDIVDVISSYFPLRRTGASFKALCPFHEEKNPSFIVSPSRQRFHCFGCGADGDVFSFVMEYEHVDFRCALRKLAARPGTAAANTTRAPAITRPQARQCHYVGQLQPMTLDFLEIGGKDDLKRLAALRGLAVEALQMASAAGVLRFATLRGFRAWIVTDQTRYVAEARRLDGQPWEHISGAKSWTLPGGSEGRKCWPLGIFEAQRCRAIALVEGAPDFLAAFHWIWIEARADVAPIAILGASLSIHPVALPLFRGKRVRIFPHMDAARFNGFDAARRWEAQLQSVGAIVDCFDCSGLIRNDGHAVSDLNDLCFAGPEIDELMP